jgi:REP element-mobilizing transposase RayT
MEEIVEKHRHHLPHLQLTEQIIFLTWRLAFTLPKPMLEHIDQMRDTLQQIHARGLYTSEELYLEYYQQLEKYDTYLGKCELAGFSLCAAGIGDMITETFRFYDGKLYELHCYCVMPNHVHLLVRPMQDEAGTFHKDSVIVQRIKSFTARQINTSRGFAGKVWCENYFDRYIRHEKDYYKVVEYILNNPLKAGLVKDPGHWRHAWFRGQLI